MHAQNAEALNKERQWIDWLKSHKGVLEGKEGAEAKALVSDIDRDLNSKNLSRDKFMELQERVFDYFSKEYSISYIDHISNMALLYAKDNSALSNSVFEVKRRRIIKMDEEGKYIPFCTRLLFLKYYSKDETELHSWGEKDREDYQHAIERVLKEYLPQ